MQGQTKQIHDQHDHQAARAIVLQVLRDDHDECWPRATLEVSLPDFEPQTIDHALAHLRDEGVVELAGETVRATRAARCLDELEMLAV